MTKGFPFTGDVENDIPGYKDGNDYYQRAVLKVVGRDVPLVLDAIPARGRESVLTIAKQCYGLDLPD